MSNALNTPKRLAVLIWSHISAAVALVMIAAALLIGMRIGSPSQPESPSPLHAHAEEPEKQPSVYTCSMHPTVRLQDPDAKCPICFMGLIPVAGGGGGDQDQPTLTLSEQARALSTIETARVERFFPTAEVRLFGKLAYDETSVARLSAYFPGRIERLFVNYIGVPVQNGDHLAELYSPELLTAFEELRQAKQTQERSADASDFLRDAAQETLQAVRQKLHLFGLSDEQIQQAESGVMSDNKITIHSPITGIVTKLSVREGDYLNTGDPIATVANLSRLWLDLQAYESQLPLLHWGLRVTFTVEAIPGETFSGRVSFIEPIINNTTRTATVRVAVDNPDFKLKPGMFVTAIAQPKISATGALLPDDLAGTWVSPMHPTIVKDEPGTCDICGMDLVPAETLGVVTDPASITTPLVIPKTAVLFTGARSVVYIRLPNTDNPTYEARTVELGPRATDYYTVRSGLVEGEEVVVNGAFRIDSAMQIQAKPSMMSPQGGQSTPNMHHGEHQNMSPIKPPKPAPKIFITQLDPTYNAYLNAQERLADDDLDGFHQESARLLQAIQRIDDSKLDSKARTAWLRIKKQLESEAPAITIDQARVHFEHLSEAIIELERTFGHSQNETWNTAFCPMAFDFEGATWLQRGTTINNPYFGDAMLRCGDLRESFKPAAPDSEPTHD